MHTIYGDIVALDAQAVRASVELVERARPADMARPTPCADWTLHGLITHMTAQHYGFAPPPLGPRPGRRLPRVRRGRAGRVFRRRGTGPPVPAARVRGRAGLPGAA